MAHLNKSVSIKALSVKTRQVLSASLNSPKVIPVSHGLTPDWKGLASLCKLDHLICNLLLTSSDPTQDLLNQWHEFSPKSSNLNQLIQFLEQLKRYDVIQDTKELLAEDIKQFKKKYQIYDALLLFAEEDEGAQDFAEKLTDKLETEYQMKLFRLDRNLKAGNLVFDEITKLIIDECQTLLVVLTKTLLDSIEHNFYVSFAHSFSIKCSSKKVIYCVENIDTLPKSYRMRTDCFITLYFDKNRFFWTRLANSMKPSDDQD